MRRIIEGIFTLSGAVTTITILLIVVFLFREGFGLFRSPVVEKGYALCLNADNPVQKLTSHQIKQIFDYEIEDWAAVGGLEMPIEIFRLEYEITSKELGDMIAEQSGIIAFLPEEYVPEQGVKVLRAGNISIGDFFGGREWIPTATPAPQLGILPLVLGTLWVSVVAILIALPLGLGVAIYLSELASARMRKLLKPTKNFKKRLKFEKNISATNN